MYRRPFVVGNGVFCTRTRNCFALVVSGNSNARAVCC